MCGSSASLAQRMGFTEACFRDTPEEMIRQALAIGADGHSTNAGDGAHHVRRSGARRTHSARISFAILKRGRSAVHLRTSCQRLPARSNFSRRRWLQRAKTAFRDLFLRLNRAGVKQRSSYPLELLSRKNDNYMNSTFANLPGHRKMEARTNQRLEIHPDDAKARGIGEGDPVRVFNDRGSLELTAMLNAHLPAAWWLRGSIGPSCTPAARTLTRSPASG